MTFIDLEKIYDSLKELDFEGLEAKMVLRHYIELINDMYANANTSMKILTGKTKNFQRKSVYTIYLF